MVEEKFDGNMANMLIVNILTPLLPRCRNLPAA